VTAPIELPEQSAPLPWHAGTAQQLVAQLDRGRLPHALLLNGPQYSGKSQLALSLARRLLCSDAKGATNCGQCHACVLSATGAHGDFRWVTPEEKSRMIKVDQIRDAVQFATRTASFGLRKVIVLQPADAMNLNACNAVLKSLEEPTGDTYWILVCDKLYTLPATIRSRCQIQRLVMPDEDSSLAWLAGVTGDPAQGRELLSLADGRPLLAQQYVDDGEVGEIAARRRGLQALLAGTISVPEATGLWGDVESDTFLQNLSEDLQRLSVSLPVERLRTRQGRAVFELMDEVNRLQRVVSAGANPAKQLLVEATLLKIRRQLGAGLLGDNI
jgi:DNA polymerase-3 subunit delta'